MMCAINKHFRDSLLRKVGMSRGAALRSSVTSLHQVVAYYFGFAVVSRSYTSSRKRKERLCASLRRLSMVSIESHQYRPF